MLSITRERLRQGHRTGKFPRQEPVLPERFRGLPELNQSITGAERTAATGSCPFEALSERDGKLTIDLGRCLFCADCPAVAQGALSFQP